MKKAIPGAKRLASLASRPIVALFVVLLLLAALPVAVWLDLASISERTLRTQANAFDRVMTSIRNFYSSNVVNRVLSSQGQVKVVSNYHDVPGGIPIPATLSLELGRVVAEQQGNVIIVSSPTIRSPIAPRTCSTPRARSLGDFAAGSAGPHLPARRNAVRQPVSAGRADLDGRACVTCHNSHPESPRTDWKVGDVRGIQEISVRQPIGANILSFKYLLAYFALGGRNRHHVHRLATPAGRAHRRDEQRAARGERLPRCRYQ